LAGARQRKCRAALAREPGKRELNMQDVAFGRDDRNSDCRYDKEFLLATLRAELLRAKAWVGDIEALGIALKGGLISSAQAVAHMHDLGVMPPLAKEIEEPAA
jgi:hypothetical protein